MKIREIIATVANQMAHKAQNDAWEDYKKKVQNIIKIASNEGKFECFIGQLTCPSSDCWKETIGWLRGLGYVVSWQYGGSMACVKWDDLSIAKINTTTEPRPATVKYYGPTPAGVSYAWEFDKDTYDFVCARCERHSEYTTDYCPNCGAKMFVSEGKKRKDYDS